MARLIKLIGRFIHESELLLTIVHCFIENRWHYLQSYSFCQTITDRCYLIGS